VPIEGISSGERVAAAGGGLAELAAWYRQQHHQERSLRPAGALRCINGIAPAY